MHDDYQPRHRADVPVDYIRIDPTRRLPRPRHDSTKEPWRPRVVDESYEFPATDLAPFIAQTKADVRTFTNAYGPGNLDDPMVEQ